METSSVLCIIVFKMGKLKVAYSFTSDVIQIRYRRILSLKNAATKCRIEETLLVLHYTVVVAGDAIPSAGKRLRSGRPAEPRVMK